MEKKNHFVLLQRNIFFYCPSGCYQRNKYSPFLLLQDANFNFFLSFLQIDNMKVLLVLVGVIAAASAVSFFELVHEEWKSFKVSDFLLLFYFLCMAM